MKFHLCRDKSKFHYPSRLESFFVIEVHVHREITSIQSDNPYICQQHWSRCRWTGLLWHEMSWTRRIFKFNCYKFFPSVSNLFHFLYSLFYLPLSSACITELHSCLCSWGFLHPVECKTLDATWLGLCIGLSIILKANYIHFVTQLLLGIIGSLKLFDKLLKFNKWDAMWKMFVTLWHVTNLLELSLLWFINIQ